MTKNNKGSIEQYRTSNKMQEKTYNEMALALVSFQIKLIYHIIFFFFHNHNHIHKLTNLDFFFFSLPPQRLATSLQHRHHFCTWIELFFALFFSLWFMENDQGYFPVNPIAR